MNSSASPNDTPAENCDCRAPLQQQTAVQEAGPHHILSLLIKIGERTIDEGQYERPSVAQEPTLRKGTAT